MAKYPVVVYGASGYTGMLIMDWLIDQDIPFTAVARNARRVKEMMAQRVVRLDSATYEIVEAEQVQDPGERGRPAAMHAQHEHAHRHSLLATASPGRRAPAALMAIDLA